MKLFTLNDYKLLIWISWGTYVRTEGRTDQWVDGLSDWFSDFSGKDGQSVLKVNEAGADSGLSLILNVQQYEYFGIQAISAGLKIRVHRQNTLPIVGRLGFSAGPGTSVFAGIRKKRVSYIRKQSGLCKYHNRSNRMGLSRLCSATFG